MNYNQVDEQLKVTKPLPNGAATIYSDGIQVKDDASKPFLANCELVIEAPAMGATPMPDAKTMKYSVEHDDDPAFASVSVLGLDVLTQTGAGGVGVLEQTVRFRLPSTTKKHVRVRAIGSATGNASTLSVTASLRT